MTIPLLILFASTTTLLFMFIMGLRRKMHAANPVETHCNASLQILEIVERFKFFQGKNLETFSHLLTANNVSGIEQLIREKFEAQGKPNASGLAFEVAKKLRS